MDLIISKLIPLLIILLIGVLLQKSKDITPKVINGLKFIILKISLPAVLFFAFSNVTLEVRYSLLFILIFLFCCFLYLIGYFLKPKLKYEYTAEYFTGFEFGMLGVALFSSIWGVENLPIIALVALGHEVFIWFVYAPLLQYKSSHEVHMLQSFISFLKSPIIISIFAGIIVNILDLYPLINSSVLGGSIFNTLNILSVITVPLILIVVGYSIRLKETNWLASVKLVAIRFLTVMVVGIGTYYLILLLVGEIDELFLKAFFAFILLPPPFILPIMMKKDSDEILFFSNTIIIYTLWSFICFVGLMLL
ncbi:AEC family transporter [Lutibacter flavus]|uniref:Membrane transport protein n=1 Tax=Lutibacter flavus TaxID=691689 RepID=A0A238VLS2_9FLAO|nr:hypothetical protein [Lutibacter flavus]SNR35148.1 hypothetical protein SAMN04488111_0682 [Lutibacter flavus]